MSHALTVKMCVLLREVAFDLLSHRKLTVSEGIASWEEVLSR